MLLVMLHTIHDVVSQCRTPKILKYPLRKDDYCGHDPDEFHIERLCKMSVMDEDYVQPTK